MDDEKLVNLIARCGLRDQKALELLYQKTAAYLNAVAYRIVGSSDLSNDVLQEAFVQIWDNAASYLPSQAKPLTWMSSIVRYRAIDIVRREQRHKQRPHPDEEADFIENRLSEQSQEEVMNRLELNQQLRDCLDSMNANFRQIVELAYLYGYSREDLATRLDANVNTIKSWLRRGSAKLKTCLENTQEGGE